MASKRCSVFISSTYEDLIPYRKAIIETLLKNRYQVLAMERSPTSPKEPLVACLDDIAEADAFVGIYAWRYGFVPQDSAVSITEQELLEAQRLEKRVFCFLVDESFEWPASFREEEGARKLEALKRRIKDQYKLDSDPFTTPDSLALNVLSALTLWQDVPDPPVSPEREILLRLLDEVENRWIDRILRLAVPYGWRLRIEREERPEAVGRSVPEEWRPEMTAGRSGEPLYDFLQSRKLLLLGEPGSGKTIALLELARGLARIARKDPAAPVPVVFNLSSWEGDDQRLDGWMAQELHKRYGANEEAAKGWIAQNQILPLLDGLDEIPSKNARSSCVKAINDHLEDKGLQNPGMAVTCHWHVYRELPGRLHRLETAVLLRPLTPAQVDRHLAGSEPAFSGLRTALARDAGLRELAGTPLMVYLLKRTFPGEALEPLPPGLAKDQTAPLWEAFVTRMLKTQLPWSLAADDEGSRGWRFWRIRRSWSRSGEGPSALPPSKDRLSPGEREIRRFLAWLARGLALHNRAQLQIERLQPSWLSIPAIHGGNPGSLPCAVYSLLYHVAGCVLLTLPLALGTGRAGFAAAGLLAGLLVGALEISRLLRKAPRALGKLGVPGRVVFRTLYLGGLTGLLLVLLGMLWSRLTGASAGGLRSSAALVGLLVGVVFGYRGAVRSGKGDIRVAESFRWRGWSRRGSLLGAGSGLLASLAFWVLYLISGSRGGFGPEFWIPFSAVVALLGAALFGAFGGLGREIMPEKNWTNQGTWRSLRNAGFVALWTALLTISGLELANLAVYAAQVMKVGREELTPAVDALNRGNVLALLIAGAALGFWAGLAYSGLDFVQHFSLRLVMWIWKLAPLRLVGFLDHTVERGLLQGSSSYKFFHPLLQEYFAQTAKVRRDDGAGDGIRTRDQQLGR
ncbi:MAG TPA: DUF4062 domain-containing protein, partial [Thermoanaerobaculia bacterium]|nr:DUF4062 domain-containing protein [Thermoanaerobaculia bacterium]